jgi:hypothetical protein
MNCNNLPRENYADLPEEKMASNVVLFFLQTAEPFRGILRQKLQQKLMLLNIYIYIYIFFRFFKSSLKCDFIRRSSSYVLLVVAQQKVQGAD